MKKFDLAPLGDFISIKHGYAFKGEYFSKIPSDVILLTPGNFHREQYLYFGSNTKYYVGDIPSEYILKNNDLVVVMTDLTKKMNILGNTVIIENPKIILHNQRIGKVEIHTPDQLLKHYLLYVLNSQLVKRPIKTTASGTTVKHTSPKRILAIKVPVPPLEEQRKIAEILGAWDEEITLTERLIEAKLTRKKGLMQQLLTGKMRVPGFEGEWHTVQLEKIAKFHKGYSYKSSDYAPHPTNNNFITLKCVSKGGGFQASGLKFLMPPPKHQFAVKEGDLIFANTDLTRDARVVGAPILVPPMNGKSFISMDLTRVSIHPGYSQLFIYYLLQLQNVRNFIRARASGSTVLHLHIKSAIKVRLYMPCNLREQQKIAAVLTACDQEITLLQRKAVALRQQKKGLMEQLLTGKVRVG